MVKFDVVVPSGEDSNTDVRFDRDCDRNRIYVKIDDKFDISIRRTSEGVIVDVYAGFDLQDLMDSIAVMDDDIIQPEDIACGSSISTEENTAPGTTKQTQENS